MEYERVREEIAKELCRMDLGIAEMPTMDCEIPVVYYQRADQILSIDGIRVEAKDQSLPEPDIDIHIWRDYSPDMAYERALQDMLKPDSEGRVWVKVEPKGGKE